MKCEKCGKTATSHVTSVMNGKKEVHHYCNECFIQTQPFGNIAKGLNLPSFVVEEIGQDFDENVDGEDGLDENVETFECVSCDEEGNNVPDFLKNIVMSFAGEVFENGVAAQTEKGEDAAKKDSALKNCPCCGMSLADVSKTQKAGCAKCYQVFDNVLMKKYRRFSDGKNYSGKDYSPKLIWNDIDYLQNELSIAVKNQNFELAAQLRDGMKNLQKEGKR
ncbi:MAG: UvrB/UvrC motif-containing protein [Chitinivibrionia bacterium]|nr:UvrB/UvrC motif-containing protein [Chitinivibrionia bacterium]